MTIRASRPRSAIVAATSCDAGRRVERAPPLGARAPCRPAAACRASTRSSAASSRRSRTPSQASRKPTISSPWTRSPLRTTARITAFSPGQSPPPVRMPTRTGSSVGVRGRRRAINRRRGLGRQPTGAVAAAAQGVGDLRRRSWPWSSSCSSATTAPAADPRRPARQRAAVPRARATCWPSSATSARRWPSCARRGPAPPSGAAERRRGAGRAAPPPHRRAARRPVRTGRRRAERR